MEGKKERIEIIDGIRGLAVVLMVIHHFLYDLVSILGAPAWIFGNPIFVALQFVFASLFILLSGVSSQFSRSNTRRGLKVIAVALALTLVTTLIGAPIRFGVLHLLGFAMLFYGLTRTLWDQLPRRMMLLIYAVLFIGTLILTRTVETSCPYIWMFGFCTPEFFSADYYPILPWLFMFMIGTVVGTYIVERRLPPRFYTAKMPFFPKVGRHALLIYILHQPVLMGLTMLIRMIFM